MIRREWCIIERRPTLSFKNAILGLLADGPLHGYELKSAYEGDLLPSAKLNFGQVYTTLERLSRDGLVEFEQVNQPVRPDKKVYSLTDAGRGSWRKWVSSPTKPARDQRDETFLKIMLARRAKRCDPLKCLAMERKASIRRLQEVTQAKLKAEKELKTGKEGAQVQNVLMLELATLQLEAFLKWLDRCEEVLTAEKKR